jgi:putative transposase
MLVQRAHKYRLEPTPEQVEWLERCVGACRYIYNIALEQRRDHWRKAKLSYVQQARELTKCRSEFDWLSSIPIHFLQNALKDLDLAFQRFFFGASGHPKPRKRFRNDSFRESDPACIDFKRLNRRKGAVRLPKVGWIKLRDWRSLGGKLRNATVSVRAGHWYISIQWNCEIPDPPKSSLPTTGCDRGVKVFAAIRDRRIEAPKHFRKIEEKLAKLQRRLSRKTKFSANWQKLMAKIRRLYVHAANARKDFLHKSSTEIAKSHGVVKVERLNVKGMSACAKGTLGEPGRNVRQKSGLNKAILDQGWYMFTTMLGYKLTERGGKLQEVEAKYTSQTCAECGVIDTRSRSGELFKCVACGHEDHADSNDERNQRAARTLAPKSPKRTLKKVGKRNQTVARATAKQAA